MIFKKCVKIDSLRKPTFQTKMSARAARKALICPRKGRLLWSSFNHRIFSRHYRKYIHIMRYANYLYYYK